MYSKDKFWKGTISIRNTKRSLIFSRHTSKETIKKKRSSKHKSIHLVQLGELGKHLTTIIFKIRKHRKKTGSHHTRPLKSERRRDGDKVPDGAWRGLLGRKIDCYWRITPSVWNHPKEPVLQAFHVPQISMLSIQTVQCQQRRLLPKIPTQDRKLDLGMSLTGDSVFRAV